MKILIYSEEEYPKKHIQLIIQQLSKDIENQISFRSGKYLLKTQLEKFDVYVFVIYHLEILKQLKEKVKNGNQVVVVTENTDVNFILTCIDYTKNLIYLKSPVSRIVQKILSIHDKK